MANGQEDRKGTAPDPGNTLFVVYVGFVMVIILLSMVVDGYAALDPNSNREVSLSEVRQGVLLFAAGGDEGKYVAAPQLSQDVKIYISAMTARTMVRQRFSNNTDRWQEAIYVFPLPDESAVDQLRMVIGQRVIEGEIREKEEAKKVYLEARKEGKKASLLSQERANIFTMAVANIAPGEVIEVEIEFQQVVALSDGIFSLRFPMVVGPRYIPGSPLLSDREAGETIQFSGTGWAMDSDRVPDASRITPPVATAAQQNPVRLMVELAAGFSVARVESLYHGITVDDKEGNVKLIRFDGRVKADRDFVLEWEAVQQHRPQAALFSEKHGSDTYLLLMLSPPVPDLAGQAPPRELVFVLDTSGSMAGPSILQAREALMLAITRLSEHDRFNVIEFNHNARRLFDHAEAADAEHRKEAIRFVRSLTADGGTEIAKALDLALDGKRDHERIRQVMFLTDGSVGNEKELLAMIASRLGDSRLFTVGIGSAPNSYFMSRAAVMGRGTYTYIGKTSEVEEKMARLFQKLEHPAITDIVVKNSSGQSLSGYPDPVPDLYAGEPLVVSLKLPQGAEQEHLHISGGLGTGLWQEDVNIQNLAKRPGIATLWARKKIRSLMDSLALGATEEDIRREVLATALSHHLVSRYTSLVAVEKEVSRPPEEALSQSALKNNLPHGWQAQKIFGGTAKTATPAQLQMIVGVLLLLTALLFLFRIRRQRA